MIVHFQAFHRLEPHRQVHMYMYMYMYGIHGNVCQEKISPIHVHVHVHVIRWQKFYQQIFYITRYVPLTTSELCWRN